MIGESFKIPEEHLENLKNTNEEIRAHSSAMDHHTRSRIQAQKRVWASIKDIMPDLDHEEYTFSFNGENGIIECISANAKRWDY